MSETHRITVDPGQCGGRPCLRGLRIRVRDVLDLLAAGGRPRGNFSGLSAAGGRRHYRRAGICRASERPSRAARGLMRFLVDAQLPPALARWLADKGHKAAHVGDLGMQAAADAAIWDYALASSSAIVTKDEDFAQRKVLAETGPVVVWIRLPNTRRRDLLAWFGTVLPDVLAALARGETLVEVT